MKYIIAITLLSVGCKCTECEEPDFKPLSPPSILPDVPPEQFLTPLDAEDLLYHRPNIARKSATEEDYFPPKEVA